MTIETTKESICINRLIGQKDETRMVEEDLIVPDIKPDILSLIMTSGNVFIYKKELLEDKIKIDGTVQSYIVYLSDDAGGNTRTLQYNIDFSETIPFKDTMPEMDANAIATINFIDAKILNGRKINIRVNINFNVKLYSNDNINIVSEINGTKDIQKLNRSVEVNSLIGKGRTKGVAKENIAIDLEDSLSEIMMVDIKIINKDAKISYNKVLLKADCNIRILYLTENSRIKSIESVIPVMGFIDIPGVSDDHLCDANYEMKNFIIKPNNEEEHSVYVEAELEMKCSVFEKKHIVYTEDIYSPINNIDYTEKQIKAMTEKLTLKDTYAMSEKIFVPEIDGNEIYNVRITPDISFKKVQNEKIMFDGKLILSILYGNENRIETKETTLPVKYIMELHDISDSSDIDTEVEITRQEVSALSGGGFNVDLEIAFTINSSSFSNISVIDNITESDKPKEDNYSLIIYFIKPGDTAWKIAKKFRSTVDEIVRVNEIENADILLERNKIVYTKIQ